MSQSVDSMEIGSKWRYGELPEKYRNPSICGLRYREVMAHLMQGNVDRDSRSGDKNTMIGPSGGLSMQQSGLLVIQVELHARRECSELCHGYG
jgi:hypothetical protein